MIRRTALGVLAAAAAGCASVATPDRIVEVASGRELTRAELLATLRDADFVLLGELHDNPLHHRLRGELIGALGPVPVVAEHLTSGRRVQFGGDRLASLQAAGFEPRGWAWPLHEPLFAAIEHAGGALTGGNPPRETVRQIARDGRLPPDLAALAEAAPLAPAASAALDDDLRQGHCGQLPEARVPAMRQAQRARDAAMAQALLAALARGPRPAVLVAGNGHVRTDYGVPPLLAAQAPGRRIVAVGFEEAGTAAAAPYTHLWITARTEREDPCAGLKLR